MKKEFLMIRVDKMTKDHFVNTIKRKGFSSITKAVGYATEMAFGINVAECIDNLREEE